MKGDAGTDDHVNVSLLAEYAISTVSGNAPVVLAVTDIVAFVATNAGIPERTTVPSVDLPEIPDGTFDVNEMGVPAAAVKLIVIEGIASPTVKFREGTLDVAERTLDATVKLSSFEAVRPLCVVAVTVATLSDESVIGVPEMSPVVEMESPSGRLDAVYAAMGTFDGYRVFAVT